MRCARLLQGCLSIHHLACRTSKKLQSVNARQQPSRSLSRLRSLLSFCFGKHGTAFNPLLTRQTRSVNVQSREPPSTYARDNFTFTAPTQSSPVLALFPWANAAISACRAAKWTRDSRSSIPSSVGVPSFPSAIGPPEFGSMENRAPSACGFSNGCIVSQLWNLQTDSLLGASS